MAKASKKLTFPENLVKEPIIYQMAIRHNLMPNIKRARVSETAGEVVLEIEGVEADIDKGLAYVKKLGVIVEDIPGDIIEG